MDQNETLKPSEHNSIEAENNQDNIEENYREANTNNESQETNLSINVISEELDNETIEKLRGDAIGDTMYSQSFVITTLLQLSDLKWSEKVEEDLCFLWDMTLEKDVVDYLFKLSFPSLACSLLLKYDERRFIEIIVGILGNISCSESSALIKDEEIEIVLSLLDSADHLILIQVMRFIKAVSFKTDKLHYITREMLEKIYFILKNSRNKDLLTVTLDVVSKITQDFKLDERLLSSAVLKSMLSAYRTINYDDSNLEDDTLGAEQRTTLTYLVQIVLNICSYINVSNTNRLLLDVNKHSSKLDDTFCKTFQYFVNKNNLLPLRDDVKFVFDAFTIIHALNTNGEEVSVFIELLQYLLSVGNIKQLKEDLSRCKYDTTQILHLVVQQKSETSTKFQVNVNLLISECKNIK